MTTAAVEKWLTLDDVAGALRVSTQTAKRWVREGRIPQPIRVGRRLLFSAAEIHGHLESLRREGYARSTIKRQVMLAACFSRWLERTGVQPERVRPAIPRCT